MFKVLTLPLFVSVFIHALIVAIVLMGLPNSDSALVIKKPVPSYIKAELVTIEKPSVKKTKPKPVKKKQIVKKKNPDNSSKLAAKEKAKQLQLDKQRKIQQQKEQERIAREQQEQARLEQERLQREEIERELIDAIAMENAQQQAETDEDLASAYTSLISARITENWSRPPSARNNMEAELVLQLVPIGDVVSVSVVKSSGNAEFDRSAEQAVLRAQRFPELQKLPIRVFEKYFRRFRLVFRPEDLRQ